MEQRTIESFFFLALLTGTLVLVAIMFWPFFSILFLSAVLAFLLSGVNERLSVALGNRTTAALATTVGAFLVILVPFGLFIWQALGEASDLYGYFLLNGVPDSLINTIETVWARVGSLAPWLAIDQTSIGTALQTVLSWIISHTGAIFAGIGNAVLDTLVMLFVLFFFLRDSVSMKRKLMDISPLSDTHENQIIHKVALTVGATVRGKLLLGFLQGLVAGIGFWIFGVPAPALWGAAVVVASFVPTIGTAIIAIPLIVYLFVTSGSSAALGLALWSGIIVSLLDNFLGPKLMARGTQVHPLLMFLAVLGGLAMFGPIGIILGPVVMALLYALLDIYLSLVGAPQR